MIVKQYDYLILMAASRKDLVEKVRKKQEEGWEVQGGPQNSEEGWSQAVVLRQQ